MPTSSITKSFVISGEDQIQKFLNAIEESEKNRLGYTISVSAKEIQGEAELREFMKEWREKNMSQYLYFFVKTKDNDSFICLDSFSRSTDMFEACRIHQAPFEHIKKLDIEILYKIERYFYSKITDAKRKKKKLESKKAEIYKCENSLNEKIEAIDEIDFLIEEVNLDSLQEDIKFINWIYNIIKYKNENVELYFGIECGNPSINDII